MLPKIICCDPTNSNSLTKVNFVVPETLSSGFKSNPFSCKTVSLKRHDEADSIFRRYNLIIKTKFTTDLSKSQ